MKNSVSAKHRKTSRWTSLCLIMLAGFQLASSGAADPDPTTGFAALVLPATASSTDASALRAFSGAPKGRQIFHGVPFTMSGPVLVTGLESARAGALFPTAISGIKAG